MKEIDINDMPKEIGWITEDVEHIVFNESFARALRESKFFKPTSNGATQIALRTAFNFGQISKSTYEKVMNIDKSQVTQNDVRSVRKALDSLGRHQQNSKRFTKSFLGVQVVQMLRNPQSLYWTNHRKNAQTRLERQRAEYGSKY